MKKQSSGYYRRQREEMLEFIPQGVVRALDVGCATGGFGYELVKMGIDVTGIEVSEEIATLAKDILQNVLVGTLDENIENLPRNNFDLIVFNDVLEHMQDPLAALKQARELLNSNGKIIASIPNIRHHTIIHQLLREGNFHYTDEGILDRTHLRFFTRSSIIELFEEAGYKIEIIKGLNPSNIPLKMRILSKLAFFKPNELSYLQFGLRAHLKRTI